MKPINPINYKLPNLYDQIRAIQPQITLTTACITRTSMWSTLRANCIPSKQPSRKSTPKCQTLVAEVALTSTNILLYSRWSTNTTILPGTCLLSVFSCIGWYSLGANFEVLAFKMMSCASRVLGRSFGKIGLPWIFIL